jgi:hypothetical protein
MEDCKETFPDLSQPPPCADVVSGESPIWYIFPVHLFIFNAMALPSPPS